MNTLTYLSQYVVLFATYVIFHQSYSVSRSCLHEINLNFLFMDLKKKLVLITLLIVVFSTDDFYCSKNHRCIPMLWVCDGEDDCGTGEDEHKGCGRALTLFFIVYF